MVEVTIHYRVAISSRKGKSGKSPPHFCEIQNIEAIKLSCKLTLFAVKYDHSTIQCHAKYATWKVLK